MRLDYGGVQAVEKHWLTTSDSLNIRLNNFWIRIAMYGVFILYEYYILHDVDQVRGKSLTCHDIIAH